MLVIVALLLTYVLSTYKRDSNGASKTDTSSNAEACRKRSKSIRIPTGPGEITMLTRVCIKGMLGLKVAPITIGR